jgi:light-regulated signal transduction histidine kinase (bacteriophytochrome)
VSQVAETGSALNLEFRVLRADGTSRWLLSAAVILRDANGKGVRVVGLNMDVTHRRESEARLAAQNSELERRADELYRSNTELERFAYVAAHDLQEPLRMVSAYSELLVRTVGSAVDDVPAARTCVDFMCGGVKRMEQVIRGLLNYSRVVHDNEQNMRTVDVNEVLAESCIMLRQTIDSQQAVISSDLLPVLRADPTQLVQVFQNLLSNALKYRKRGVTPAVHVAARQYGDGWLFSVRDNGIGIAPEHHERIFGIFKRLHRDEYPGVGIGLASARRLVDLHGGRIWVESEAGKGSTFFFTLPRR